MEVEDLLKLYWDEFVYCPDGWHCRRLFLDTHVTERQQTCDYGASCLHRTLMYGTALLIDVCVKQ